LLPRVTMKFLSRLSGFVEGTTTISHDMFPICEDARGMSGFQNVLARTGYHLAWQTWPFTSKTKDLYDYRHITPQSGHLAICNHCAGISRELQLNMQDTLQIPLVSISRPRGPVNRPPISASLKQIFHIQAITMRHCAA
jgi:hypothetical protein